MLILITREVADYLERIMYCLISGELVAESTLILFILQAGRSRFVFFYVTLFYASLFLLTFYLCINLNSIV